MKSKKINMLLNQRNIIKDYKTINLINKKLQFNCNIIKNISCEIILICIFAPEFQVEFSLK